MSLSAAVQPVLGHPLGAAGEAAAPLPPGSLQDERPGLVLERHRLLEQGVAEAPLHGVARVELQRVGLIEQLDGFRIEVERPPVSTSIASCVSASIRAIVCRAHSGTSRCACSAYAVLLRMFSSALSTRRMPRPG